MKDCAFFTTLSENEVIIVLSNLASPQNDVRCFCGEVFKNKFSLMKYQPFSNNVLNPCINGTISKSDKGTAITVSAELNKKDKIGFSILLVLSLCVVLFMLIYGLIQKTYNFIEPIFAVMIFELFCAYIGYVVFSLKAKRIISTLVKHLEK